MTSAAKSLVSLMSPSTQHWSIFKKSQPSTSSVAPITEATVATVTQEPSSAVQIAESISTVKKKTLKKIPSKKVVQLLAKGVWVMRRLAANICEVTLVNRLEDTGDPKKIFNRKISR